jgi:hypothetical protein
MNMSMQTQYWLIALDSRPHGSGTDRFEARLTQAALHFQVGVQFWRIIQSASKRGDMQIHDQRIGPFHLCHQRINALCQFIFAALARRVPGGWIRPTEANHFAGVIELDWSAFGIAYDTTGVQRI